MEKIVETDSSNKIKEVRESKDSIVKTKKKVGSKKWIFIVLVTTLFLSFSISVLLELIYISINYSMGKIIVASISLLLIIGISIVADMIGVAATASELQPFLAMASRKVKGSTWAVYLCKNADRVGSIFGDIIGDVCGIVSGAAGAAISAVIISSFFPETPELSTIFISVGISAVIAALVITGKAICKSYAVTHANEITLSLAKFLSVFKK